MNDLHDVSDARLSEAYRVLLRGRRTGRRECVSPDELLAVLEETLAEPERLRVLRHVGSCASCRKELELLRAARDAAELAARPAWVRAPVLAAAAAMVLALGGLALWSRATPDPTDRMRTGEVAGAVALLEPPADGLAARPVTLRWSRVPDAGRYEVEVLTRDGSPLYVTTTRDTFVTVADSALVLGSEFRWWIRAVLPDGSQPASAVRRFRLTTP